MKTTVKMTETTRAVVTRSNLGGISLEIKTSTPGNTNMTDRTDTERFYFTPDQWGALMVGGEMALEVTA